MKEREEKTQEECAKAVQEECAKAVQEECVKAVHEECEKQAREGGRGSGSGFSGKREKLIRQLERYEPVNEQEERDRVLILQLLAEKEDLFFRDSLAAHMTSSAWVVNPDRTKILMAYHNIYDSWSWLGGHADGDEDLLAVAMREVTEESGISAVRPLSDDIYSVEILTVDGHEKKGKYVSSHLHLNITWLLEAADSERTRAKEDENSAVAWFAVDEAVGMSSEPWFRERIYSKLNKKLREYTGK